MQLKKIKLAGFKSFVDPTVVPLPSRLVAVVGPNGCGKSNIIDAVCWVMGETSAKYLRGESLTDVIFNGSTSRKPIGQASVELIFDNQDGTIGGEYASYAEISVRRVITREGDSSYFLNGARCRRRDIIGIFLGTGLGPRSYSIIGQNMISRIIEAKPDEMRVYMEEAAGVSKYKERRRETENRIQHTKDNLARLDDIRLELEKQLGTLKRQSASAEKFKQLKQEERTLRGHWQAMQWKDLDGSLVSYTLQIQQQETGLEARQADLSHLNLGIDKKREEQIVANENFQDIQRRYYAVGNEITRIEQEMRHHQERQRQWQQDLEQVSHDWRTAKTEQEEVSDELQELSQDLIYLVPQSDEANEKVLSATDELSALEESMQSWQTGWDNFNQSIAKTTQTAQVEQTRMQHLEQRLASLKQRQTQLEQEQAQIDFTQLEKELAELALQLSTVSELTQNSDADITTVRKEISDQQVLQQQASTQLDQVRNQLQRLSGQQASLEALQQTALGQRNNKVVQWLQQHQLDKNPRLAQHIEVANGWELAVEKVLGANLQAICVDELASVTALTDNFKEGSLSVFSTKATQHNHATQATALLSKVKSSWSLESLLAGIYIADSQAEALSLCENLQPYESVITRDGVWLSASWLRISHEENAAAGVFQREHELKQIAAQIEELTEQQSTLENQLQTGRNRLAELEQQRDELQTTYNQIQTQLADIRAQQKSRQERYTELKTRSERLSTDLNSNIAEHEQAQSEFTHARHVWQQAMQELEEESKQRNTFVAEREALRDQLHAARTNSHQFKEEAHQIEIRLQTTKSQQASLQQNLLRMQSQIQLLDERKATLQKEMDAQTSLTIFEEELEVALNQRLSVEEELNAARAVTSENEQLLRDFEHRRHLIEAEVTKYRDMLETLRVECQSYKVKSETIVSQIIESGLQLEALLAEIPEGLVAEQCHAELEQVTQRIARLGPINLVAIEEYASCSERKEYLDRQYEDLIEGLATLEDAIQKIDKETRARFKETFDKVNERFQELFPLIFGGGKAYLELTGENLLDAGISVMACPPGKRNSTIHLLSGGEKALTAISLVFSIFHLNPAPFCILDEVDAPLDDANIGRFCNLVKTMSEKTQFIFISHNKLAIEMAEHLMGVTMHEPGVSRLVSVDIQEAVNLAGA